MFADYIDSVFQNYHRQKAANALSLRLQHPTPANLKEECLVICNERFHRKDNNVLKTFFGQADDLKACLQAIRKCHIDKFRPLVNFLKQQTNSTEEKNIELLAWLIGFEPRPYDDRNKYVADNISVLGPMQQKDTGRNNAGTMLQTPDENKAPNDAGPLYVKRNPWVMRREVVVMLLLLIVIFATGYWLWTNRNSTMALTGNEKCMYWNEDHYEPVSCSQKIENTLVIALDSARLNNFKRITTPDTITRKALGHVWYFKMNNKLEFYTADGIHPVYSEKRLKPVTLYIIEKYILHSVE